jgi:NTE family protein
MMVAIDNKQDAKSNKILEAICGLDFFKLVDGHPAARYIIQKFITNNQFVDSVKKTATLIIGVLLGLIATDFILFGLEKNYNFLVPFTMFFFGITGFYFVFLAFILYYFYNLLKRLKNAGFGINPGDYFYDWIKCQLKKNGIFTVADLKNKASQEVPGLKLRTAHPLGMEELHGNVTFIASELVTQNKIQFPEMCDLFRKPDEINTLQPAGFIRASMSIPVFFENYFINHIPVNDPDVKKAWKDRFGMENPPASARFVDGGILSNFPINIFYNPNITVPRLPSFGIDLDDTKPEPENTDAASWSLGGYFGRMFNTIRYYYDKDFLLKNAVFEKGIGKIMLPEFNWLNFFMKDEDKIKMFVRGAKAATEFLKKFDWEDYKNSRATMKAEIEKSHGMQLGGTLK